MKYVSVIDTGTNNLRSIIGAINYLGYEAIVSNNEKIIMNSSALIIPGVGSFPAGMEKLKKNRLDKIL